MHQGIQELTDDLPNRVVRDLLLLLHNPLFESHALHILHYNIIKLVSFKNLKYKFIFLSYFVQLYYALRFAFIQEIGLHVDLEIPFFLILPHDLDGHYCLHLFAVGRDYLTIGSFTKKFQ